MRLGFVGAQRVGKTTLGEAAAGKTELAFQPTTVKQIFERIGRDPKVHYPIRERLAIQYDIFEELNADWEKYDNCIFDRTPLDLLAYTEADVLRDFPTDDITVERYMRYREMCLNATAKFDALIHIQPGIKLVEAHLSAACCMPYMEHFNSLVLAYMLGGFVPASTFTYVMPRDVLDLTARVNAVSGIVSRCRLVKRGRRGAL